MPAATTTGCSSGLTRAGRRLLPRPASARRKATLPLPGLGKEPAAPRRLKYAERSELEALPARIEALEKDLGTLHQTMADPAFYQQDRLRIVEAGPLGGPGATTPRRLHPLGALGVVGGGLAPNGCCGSLR